MRHPNIWAVVVEVCNHRFSCSSSLTGLLLFLDMSRGVDNVELEQRLHDSVAASGTRYSFFLSVLTLPCFRVFCSCDKLEQ
jgi:hypothetical protein